jgi:putative flippase GtrA
MEYTRKITKSRFSRFLIVGATNSAINFAVLNLLIYETHVEKILASIAATACAITFSFTFNRSFVFRDLEKPFHKFIRFILVSYGGTLFIQTTVFAVCTSLAQHISFLATRGILEVNLGNLVASLSVMFWNYNGYRLLVFKDRQLSHAVPDETSRETA